MLVAFMMAFGAWATIGFQFSSLPSTNKEADAITPIYNPRPNVDWKAVATGLQTQHKEQEVMRPSSSSSPPLLRFDWTNLTLMSDLARRMATHQTNCSLPLGNFVYRNRYGLGSDLHVWGQALCNGMESNVRVRTLGSWTWVDQQACKTTDPTLDSIAPTTTTTTTTPMTCYFPATEIQCPGDGLLVREHPTFDSAVYNISRPNGVVKVQCDSILEQASKPNLRAAVVEYLFSHVSELVVREADRQASLVFREAPGGKAPHDLITVHIRWGDKGKEMKLVPIQDYITAVHKILKQRQAASTTESGPPSSLKANILLATEDPAVVEEFQKRMPSTWRVYVDQYFYDMLPHRIAEYNGSPKMSALLEGKPGLKALGSLLVCMEANDFVLTTESNWSRLMNELRKSILDPRCNTCTTMIDLRPVRREW
jgi:hypothetical protein